MYFIALATDYDGTLASHGRVDRETVQALRRLKSSGRKLILVTGRQREDLYRIFPEADLFDAIVAENGALIYWPETRQEDVLVPAPPKSFAETLRRRGITDLAEGRVIVATGEPWEKIVLETIREQRLELTLIFNKGAVMILPSGVNKATGLSQALKAMELSAHNVVAIGDAENDHALIAACECGVAVNNALEPLKQRADWVTTADHGAGVRELIEMMLTGKLCQIAKKKLRQAIPLGLPRDSETPLTVTPFQNILVTGTSGAGKSTLITGLLEKCAEKQYQFCILDPEGDYEKLEQAISIGTPTQPPSEEELLKLLAQPTQNTVVNLVGVKLEDRPKALLELLPRFQELRAKTGRPHWIVIDEAHHLLPSAWAPASSVLPQKFIGSIFVTNNPGELTGPVLEAIDTVVILGHQPREMVQKLCELFKIPSPPQVDDTPLPQGHALLWYPRQEDQIAELSIAPTRQSLQRHQRKYSEGELGPDKSFYFKGPEGKLNLRAQNLRTFLQLAKGIDDETWIHHLHRGDFSDWFRKEIKDESLAKAVSEIEHDTSSPLESRERIQAAIEERFMV